MQGIFTTGTWEEKSDEISFADFKFSVTHHYLVQEPSDKDGKEELGEGTWLFPSIAVRIMPEDSVTMWSPQCADLCLCGIF